MEDERQKTVDPPNENVYSETYSDFKMSGDTNLDAEEDINTDPFSNNSAVLQARIVVAEAREAEGLNAEADIKALKARQALIEAKTAFEPNDHPPSPHTSTHKIHQNESRTAPQVTAARMPQPRQKDKPIANILQFSSSICAVIGGVLLSSNTSVSKYGFILLACSSSQIFLSSLMLKQKTMMIYGGSVFLLVDCLGIYRWLLQTSI